MENNRNPPSIEKYRARVHALLLYPDCPEHVSALEIIKKSYDYVGILHDKDVDENGELKKPHWHVVLRFKEAVWSSSICKELSIAENYIEKVGKFENALTYLVHYNNPEKYKYNVDEVFGTIRSKLVELIQKEEKTECEKVCDLIAYIEDYEHILSVSAFAKFCASEGYWSEFRRSASIFLNIIQEHNFKITLQGEQKNAQI